MKRIFLHNVTFFLVWYAPHDTIIKTPHVKETFLDFLFFETCKKINWKVWYKRTALIETFLMVRENGTLKFFSHLKRWHCVEKRAKAFLWIIFNYVSLMKKHHSNSFDQKETMFCMTGFLYIYCLFFVIGLLTIILDKKIPFLFFPLCIYLVL